MPGAQRFAMGTRRASGSRRAAPHSSGLPSAHKQQESLSTGCEQRVSAAPAVHACGSANWIAHRRCRASAWWDMRGACRRRPRWLRRRVGAAAQPTGAMRTEACGAVLPLSGQPCGWYVGSLKHPVMSTVGGCAGRAGIESARVVEHWFGPAGPLCVHNVSTAPSPRFKTRFLAIET